MSLPIAPSPLESVVIDNRYGESPTQLEATVQASSSSLNNSNYSLSGLPASVGQGIAGIKNSFNYAAQATSSFFQKGFIRQGNAKILSEKIGTSSSSLSSTPPSIEDEPLTIEVRIDR